MIVVDTSALIEIAIDAARAAECRRVLAEAETLLISAGTVVETLIVSGGKRVEPHMRALLDGFGFEIVPVTEERAKAAAAGYRRYGRVWHAAALNFGDSFAYALAKEHDCPLLFVGNDFSKTDVKRAIG